MFIRSIFLFWLLFVGAMSLANAQDNLITTSDKDLTDVDDFAQIKLDRLKRIRRELIQLESKIFVNKKKIDDEDDMVVKLKLESELEKYQQDYDQKKLLFIETMTGYTVTASQSKKKEKEKSLGDDIQEILEPALTGIRAISERPREIQKLQEKIKDLKLKIESTEKARAKLEKTYKDDNYNVFKRVIKKSIKRLEQTIKDYKIQLEDSQFKLIKLENNKGSFVGAFSNIIFDFLKTKGKNLGLALSAFIFLFWLFGSAKNKVISFFVNRIVQLGRPQDKSYWFVRPIRVIYSVLGFLLALSVALMILYVLNDWVLVTFIIFILGAVVWSSKQYFPTFFEQSKIVLNLGTIRENEVVIYKHIAWRLKSLGYYCRLENPSLTGGSLRISSKELMTYHSRPVVENEPWFPSRTNDWVVLTDGTYGKVTFQSPEQVVVRLIGGAYKHFKVDQFLGLNPLNLSKGYGIEQVIGIDYQHQQPLLQEVIPRFKEKIQSYLKDFLKDEYQYVKEFMVEYMNAGASSLDIRFFLVCSGELGAKKLLLERRIQMGFVDVCNEFGYVIPFQQVTLHYPQALNERKE